MEQTKQSRELIRKVWDNKFFILFMGKRFPQETSESYIREWVGRIQDHNFSCMDKETRKAYDEAVEEQLI